VNSSNFNIKLSTAALKDLKKLRKKNPEIFSSLIKTIDSLYSDPYSGKSLKGDKKGLYSYRIGNYRVIYEIYKIEKVILIIKIGDRREVYR
jgi:mRNA interferase RelE/StbE